MLQPYALISMADFKDALTVKGDVKDEVIERAINTASRLIEADLGRRLRFRAPEEVEGAANIVAAVALSNASLTIAAQPSASRTLIVSLEDSDRSVKEGLVTVTGTVAGASTTEVFNLADGPRLHGRKFFTAVASIVVSGLKNQSTGSSDTIRVGTSLGYVEYHTPNNICPERLKLLDWPLYAVAEINEDPNRTYASTTALVVSTDYESSADGTITRVWSRVPCSFWGGYRSIKARYSAGYGGLSTVPADLKNLCLRLAGMLYQEPQRGPLGSTSVSDQLGNFTRVATGLTPAMRDDLAEYRRGDIFSTTAERDFDAEAA